MAKGRKPLAPEIKEKRGNPGQRAITRPDVDVDHISDDAPDWLNEQARAIWAKLAPDMRNLKFLRRTDELAFSRYCDAYARWMSVTASLDELTSVTYTTISKHGELKRLDPLLMAQDRLNKILLQFEDAFGLKPDARLRLIQQTVSGGLPLEEAARRDAAVNRDREKQDGPIGMLAAQPKQIH